MTAPIVKPFYDAPTGSWQYVFHDPETRQGAIIDPVLRVTIRPLVGRVYDEVLLKINAAQ